MKLKRLIQILLAKYQHVTSVDSIQQQLKQFGPKREHSKCTHCYCYYYVAAITIVIIIVIFINIIFIFIILFLLFYFYY